MFWNVLYGSAVFLILAASKLPIRDLRLINVIKFDFERFEKARRIADELCFHTKHEMIVCLLLIYGCMLGSADQQLTLFAAQFTALN